MTTTTDQASTQTSSGMRERFSDTAVDLLDTDPRVALVLADIGERFLGDAPQRHPDRLVNVGIREQLLVSATAGFAMAGLRPIAHTIGPFLLERPYEQVKLDLGHNDVGAVLVSVGASYDVSAGGPTHHGPRDVALLDTLDGWTVHVPGHADEVEALLRQAVRTDDRVYLRLAEDANARARDVLDHRFHVVRGGSKGVVLAVGPMLDRALAATEGLDVSVLYAATVRPFDAQTLRMTLMHPDVVVVEPYLEGTSAHHVAQALHDLPHRLLSIGVGRTDPRMYGTRADHDRAHGLDAMGIRRRVESFLRT